MTTLHERLVAELDPATPWDSERDDHVYDALRAVVDLHAPEPYTTYSAGLPVEFQVCGHCRSLCHSGSGIACDLPTDGVYPCQDIRTIAETLGVPIEGDAS